MKPYSCVLFDLDGTLLDTSAGIFHTIDEIIEKFHLKKLSNEEKISFIGPPIQQSFQKFYGYTDEEAWQIASAWRDLYRELFLLEASPYEGIYDLLKSLRAAGIKTGVVTNKREDYAHKILEHFSFLPLFDDVMGTDFAGTLTKANMIKLCMKHIGISNLSCTVMVGDTLGDKNAAQQSGISFLGVTYGFGFKKGIDDHGMTAFDSCTELLHYFQRN